MLNLITFFTVGPKECHAWTAERGTRCPQCAGKIHSDFEKGFGDDVEMIFYAPKGTQGSSIMSISRFGTDEGETLLNAGTQVEIVGIEDSYAHFGSSVRIFLRILEK